MATLNNNQIEADAVASDLLPNVCILLSSDTFRNDLCEALRAFAVSVNCYHDDHQLFTDFDPALIDCLVLGTGSGVVPDGLLVLEALKQRSVLVPALVIVDDGERVNHAVRAMRALASECLAVHTPVPIVARHVRTLAETALQTRLRR